MGSIQHIQSNSHSLRNDKKALNDERKEISARLEKAKSQYHTLKRQGISENDKRVLQLKHRIEKYESVKKGVLSDLSVKNDAFARLAELIKDSYNPIADIAQLDDNYPLLLFPLRLETRFKTTDNLNQLWLRVYPDDCNVVREEPLLTVDELENSKTFWCEMAKAGGIESNERGAWNVLVNNHGANRAAWMIEQYKPIMEIPSKPDETYKVLVLISENNNELKPEAETYWKEVWLAQGNAPKINAAAQKLRNSGLLSDEIDEITERTSAYNIADAIAETDIDKLIVVKGHFPNPDSIPATQSSWNDAPQAILLPDKFVAVTYSNGVKKTHIFEYAVKDYLQVGLDPGLEEGDITKDESDINLNDDLKWMVDFDEAVKAGMGTRINLTIEEANKGFDQLFVLGMRVSSDAETSKKEFENLIITHKYSKQGFEFIKQGTPTNNTEEGSSGYSWFENANEAFNRIFKQADNFTVDDDFIKQSDAQRFAECLNIDSTILQGINNANGRDQLEAIAMNSALFPATMGYFLEEMMNPIFSDSDIDNTKEFFTYCVSGRGPVPAIKIGKQPYGILPVSDFSKLNFGDSSQISYPHTRSRSSTFFLRLHNFIKKTDETWDSLTAKVSHIGKNGDPHQILLDILGLHPNSVEFHQRYAQSIRQIYNQILLQFKSPIIASGITAAIASKGKQILREFGLDPEKDKISILEKYFLSKPNLLNGPLVDDRPESETDKIRAYTPDEKNYIEWLLTTDGEKIRKQDFGGNPVPNALLYLLLRHSLQLLQSKSATNFLLNKKIIKSKKEYFDTDFLHIQKTDTTQSKFTHLYKSYHEVTGNRSETLMQYIYKPEILTAFQETSELNKMLDALRQLQDTPTARLERLLVEHLDCCSYRIDAWKTGLTYYKLIEQKNRGVSNQKAQGLYLGAYGWLMELRPKRDSLKEKTLNQSDADFFASNGEKVYEDSGNLGYIHAPSVDQAATAAILRNAYDSHRNGGTNNPFAINLSSERVRIANDFLEGIRNGQPLSALLGYQFERGLHDRYDTSNIEADKFIYPLRMAFPLVSNKLKNTTTTSEDLTEANETNNAPATGIEAIEANNVIDGLKLIQHVQSSAQKNYPFGKSNLPAANTSESAAIQKEVNRLIDINDAIADLVMAEQVYQAVKGNFERAAGVAEAFSKGTYPPEMEIVDTPRSGMSLNHKMAIHFNADASALTSPNSITKMTPRAAAEPAVNEWLSKVLPAPDKVMVKVKVTEPGKAENFLFVSQKDIGLQSIDLLFSASLDNDQAMTELDDRIINYLLFEYKTGGGNSLNPFSKIEILYTEEIDQADKSKVGFFELGTLLQSLRKLLINKPHLNHTSLTLPTEKSSNDAVAYNIVDYNNRINKLRTGLNTKNDELKAKLNSIVSIESLTDKNEAELALAGLDESSISKINEFLKNAIKEYFLNETTEKKNELSATYETMLNDYITDIGIKTTLTNKFETFLNNYATDFDNLSGLIKTTCELFMSVALFDNNLTGTGFIHQSVGEVYKSVVKKVGEVIERWEKKSEEFDQVMAGYDTTKPAEELIDILQKAERKVSATLTLPVPNNPDAYKTNIQAKRQAFINVLNELKSVESSGYSDINAFVNRTTSIVNKLSDYDIVSFDVENERNDLFEAKQNLIILKEDIYAAQKNLSEDIDKKLSSYDNEIQNIESAATDAEKIDVLLNAGKTVLKEEMILLPKLTYSTDFGESIQQSFEKKEEILQFVKSEENREFPVDDWLSGVARVRSAVWELENLISLSEGFKPENSLELTPLQFPARENARWLAMKFIGDSENYEEVINNIGGDSLLYTALLAGDFDKTKSQCGVVIDEWTEVIPTKEETTGIAFHYDQPNSEPPQTMLLVTPTNIDGQWQWDDVIGAMEETVAMAKKRAVEPAMVDKTKYAQFLPTTITAVTKHWISVVLNLAVNNLATLRD